MSDTPVLSYKVPSSQKGGSRVPSQTSTPILNNSAPSTPNIGSRKVSSRRKALQEFYNISHDEDHPGSIDSSLKSDTQTLSPTQDRSNGDKSDILPKTRTRANSTKLNLNNPEDVANFIKTGNIEDILKLRNSITNKINTHASEKKTIIYDNYYELIKLSQTLSDISNAMPLKEEKELNGLGIFSENGADDSKAAINGEDYLDSVLSDFSNFLKNDAVVFDGEFEDVVKNLQSTISKSDSTASMNVIPDSNGNKTLPDDIKIDELIKELDFLLDADTSSLSDEDKSKFVKSIDTMLDKLKSTKNELLILQLNDLKKKFQ
ncbi:hypothetical protein DFJ63DRAFT_311197 [Scheffersomyces coipomensis]|uniref:uncharacterized protein n=1 Tax=Scheffersomyces coipomensis TaxID=1788519 RepID=UPI00315D43B9